MAGVKKMRGVWCTLFYEGFGWCFTFERARIPSISRSTSCCSLALCLIDLACNFGGLQMIETLNIYRVCPNLKCTQAFAVFTLSHLETNVRGR